MRIVIDTNIWISGLLWKGDAWHLLNLAEQGKVECHSGPTSIGTQALSRNSDCDASRFFPSSGPRSVARETLLPTNRPGRRSVVTMHYHRARFRLVGCVQVHHDVADSGECMIMTNMVHCHYKHMIFLRVGPSLQAANQAAKNMPAWRIQSGLPRYGILLRRDYPPEPWQEPTGHSPQAG